MKRWILAFTIIVAAMMGTTGIRLRDLLRRIRRSCGYRSPVQPMHWRKRLAMGLPLLPIAGGSTDSGFGTVRFFHDFLEDTINVDPWIATNTNTGVPPTINIQANGVCRLTVGASANDMSSLYGPLEYKASAGGPLIFEARVALVTSLSQLVFVGLTGTACTTVASIPMDYNGGTLTTSASNAVGFYYTNGSGATMTSWACGGTKAGSDSVQTTAHAKHLPVLGTFQTLRIVVAADGNASFYIDGDIVAENVANAVTATTLLAPQFAIEGDTDAASLDIDYAYLSCGRV